jgi:hypothetical protein
MILTSHSDSRDSKAKLNINIKVLSPEAWKSPKSEAPTGGENANLGGEMQVLAISGVRWGQRFFKSDQTARFRYQPLDLLETHGNRFSNNNKTKSQMSCDIVKRTRSDHQTWPFAG